MIDCKIPLSGGGFVLVDKNDYEWLSKYKWDLRTRAHGAVTVSTTDFSTMKRILMHRMITGAPRGMHVDHANGDPLDNRRSNLRICTAYENNKNRKRNSKSSTKYKGVNIHKYGRYKATIKCDKVEYFLGTFDAQEDAAYAYNEAAKRLHGEFALLNDLPAGFVGKPKNKLGRKITREKK